MELVFVPRYDIIEGSARRVLGIVIVGLWLLLFWVGVVRNMLISPFQALVVALDLIHSPVRELGLNFFPVNAVVVPVLLDELEQQLRLAFLPVRVASRTLRRRLGFGHILE